MANVGDVTSTALTGKKVTTGTPGGDLVSQLGASALPQLAAGQLQYGLEQQQLGMVGPQLQDQMAYNNAMAGYQAQNLGIGEQQLGLQQTGLAQQGAQNAAQQGFERQQYGLQSGQYPEQKAEAALAYQNALMQTQGSQAIGGTQNTVGGKAAISTMGQNYGFQQQDIARAQALSQVGQASEESGYQYSQQQLQNAQANLSLMAKANGISEQQMLTMLNYGNQQAGVGAQQNIIQILSQMGQTGLGNVNAAGAALSPIGLAAGVNPVAGMGK
jgi:hypothetical protein